MSDQHKSGGGAATQGGVNFQNRVAAWAAVCMLADRPVGGIGPSVATPAYIRFETAEPVDDVLIGTSDGRHAFIQAKRAISLSSEVNSDFASVVDQFVRQFLSARDRSGPRPWAHALDPARDRLVLATSSDSSQPLRRDLALVLDRIRALTPGQPLGDSTHSQSERDALHTATMQVQRAWQNATGKELSDADLRDILALTHIEVLDVEADAVAEREALNLLASVIVADRAQAGAAWAKLIQMAADLSQRRSGTDEASLRTALEAAGIKLRCAPRYEKDIQRLKAYSSETARYLAHQSRITVGGQNIRVHREVVRVLRQVTDCSSAVVIGIPGAGKSGALHDYAESLTTEGQDVIFLAVDQIGAKSLGELRNELGLEHEIMEVIRNWPGARTGFVVIDAFDAARGEPASAALTTLMRAVLQANTRWNVVASIRKYDLRYSTEIRELFRGGFAVAISPEMQDLEFAGVRHVNVPLFSDEELDTVRRQAPALDGLLATAPTALKELLRVPFNLRLMAAIVEAGANVAELRPIRTQNELLRRYWQHRVLGSSGGDLRERVLKKTCELMIETRRLKVERQRILDPGLSASLDDLLSGNVLVEWQAAAGVSANRQVLAFGHHILFDFAASQLFLPSSTPHELARVIATDPDLILMIRPSIVMHFQQFWDGDRVGFWTLLYRLCADARIPQIGKVIGAAVAAESGRTLDDFTPLIDALQTNGETRSTAETALRHLVGALTAGPATVIAGANAGPYCDLLRALCEHQLNETIAGNCQTLLRAVLGNFSILTEAQLTAVGSAARHLLSYGWAQEKRSSWLVTNALRSVCKTFQSDPVASATLLRRSIEPEHLAKYGYEEMHWVARDLKEIAEHDPVLVSDIYAAMFSYEEQSAEKTDMSGSQILSLTSNRRQDYDHAKWQLGEDFPDFVYHAPEQAARAMVRVMDAYCAREHRSVNSEAVRQVFQVDDFEAVSLTDYSYIWDEGFASQHDDAVKILEAFFRDLERRVQDAAETVTVDRIVSVLIRQGRQAVIWRKLLRLGAQYPEQFGIKLRALAWATPIFTAPDTERYAAEFVPAVFPLLSHPEREKVERAILSLSNVEAKRKEAAERDQARLLGQIDESDMVTDEARALLARLCSTGVVPQPPVMEPRVEVSSRQLDDISFIEEVVGVSTGSDAHKAFLDIRRPVHEFQQKYGNQAPSAAETEAIIPALRDLRRAIEESSSTVDPKLLAMAAGSLAAGCKAIAAADHLACTNEAGDFIKSALLFLSCHPEPEHDPTHDAQFDEHHSWGAPIPRIEAAQGLMLIARHPSCCGADVLDAIQRLAGDDAPEVRYQITTHLTYLYSTAPERMWRLLEERSEKDTSSAVLDGVAYSLNRLAGAHPDRSAELSKRIFDRVRGPGAERTQDTCLHTMVDLYVWRNQALARQMLAELARNARPNRRELLVVLSDLRELIVHGNPDTPKPEDDAIRARAIELFHRVTVSACDAFTTLLAHSETSALSEPETEVLRDLARLVDHAATELYFASGAFDEKQNKGKVHSREQHTRFYQELTPTLDRLTPIGLAGVVQHLIEMLEILVPVDPRRVFLHTAALVESGKRGNYHYESLAVDHIVRIVERYLAEYRTLLQEDAECRAALRKTLDAFVEAGWPAAQQLSYRLDEIFR